MESVNVEVSSSEAPQVIVTDAKEIELESHKEEVHGSESRSPRTPTDRLHEQFKSQDLDDVLEELNNDLEEKQASKSLQGFDEVFFYLSHGTTVLEHDFLSNEPEDEASFLHFEWRLAHFLVQPRVRGVFIFLICVNALCIGFHTDDHWNDEGWLWVELVFTTLFLAELICKLTAW